MIRIINRTISCGHTARIEAFDASGEPVVYRIQAQPALTTAGGAAGPAPDVAGGQARLSAGAPGSVAAEVVLSPSAPDGHGQFAVQLPEHMVGLLEGGGSAFLMELASTGLANHPITVDVPSDIVSEASAGTVFYLGVRPE